VRFLGRSQEDAEYALRVVWPVLIGLTFLLVFMIRRSNRLRAKHRKDAKGIEKYLY
jgi:hypothetical protein